MHNCKVKWPNSKFCVDREHTKVKFRFSPWTVTPSLQILLVYSSTTLKDRLKRVGIIAKKFKRLWSHFDVKFSFAVPSWLLKLPLKGGFPLSRKFYVRMGVNLTGIVSSWIYARAHVKFTQQWKSALILLGRGTEGGLQFWSWFSWISGSVAF